MSFDVDLTVTLGARTIAASFTTGAGITVLYGRSGAGKTSVLNMMAGLLRPERGHVRVGGATLFDPSRRIDLPPERRRLGYVFQDARLFPHRRVRTNLLYGHRLAAPEARWLDVDETIALLGIAPLLDRWPRSLSGGEAQRVAIGRALLSGATALMMDEPLAALDPERRDEILTLIERIRDTLGLPILYVTHDVAEAERLATTRIEIA
jgi:molybdate transport system ATP-binding protein